MVQVDVLPLLQHDLEQVGKGKDPAEDAALQPRLRPVHQHGLLAEEPGEPFVALHDVEVPVHDHHAGGHGPQQGVGLLLGLVPHVDHAHLRFRPAEGQGRRKLPARPVAAPPAVYLVFRPVLPHSPQGVLQIIFTHFRGVGPQQEQMPRSVR